MKSVGWATLVSLSVHGALGWAVLRAPAGWFGASRDIEPISIELIEPPRPVTPLVEPDEPPPEPPPPLPPSEPDATPSEDVPAALTPQLGLPGPVDPSEPTATGAAAPDNAPPVDVPDVSSDQPPRVDPSDARAMQVLLNPANVARGSFVPTGPGPSQRGAAPGLASVSGERPSEADIERQHRDHLRGQAMARPWLARTEPELRRQPDGSLLYDGHRFRARIRPDGSVQFEDHGNAQTNGFSASGSFDLTDAIMGASGQDPHAAERDWFMRRTREVRERLEAQHRAQENAAGLARLRGRLGRVWATTSRSTAARRRRLFDIWDEMAEDDTGRRGRDIVYAFIRETIPAGSEDAYTESELTRLNASRDSRALFDPY